MNSSSRCQGFLAAKKQNKQKKTPKKPENSPPPCRRGGRGVLSASGVDVKLAGAPPSGVQRSLPRAKGKHTDQQNHAQIDQMHSIKRDLSVS